MSDTVIKLGPGQARELRSIPDFHQASIDGIATASGVSYSTARVHLNKLLAKGLVKRYTAPGGRSYYSTTELGRSVIVVEKRVNNSLAAPLDYTEREVEHDLVSS